MAKSFSDILSDKLFYIEFIKEISECLSDHGRESDVSVIDCCYGSVAVSVAITFFVAVRVVSEIVY